MKSSKRSEHNNKQIVIESYPEVTREKKKSVESSTKRIDAASELKIGSVLRTWAEVSRINYLPAEPLDVTSGHNIRRRSVGQSGKRFSVQCLVPSMPCDKSDKDIFTEQFPVHVNSLMDEDQLWGCFYIFPELYADEYSPVVSIWDVDEIPELVNGVLTRDMIAANLSYLRRIPILGDFRLIDINVLQHYKYLVYLDLSYNLISELTVLSFLPYLQFLSVAFNRLNTVLEYETPQWFLTEVHYKFNSVEKIRDLSLFWSITILDLSHNNIKRISGLENLRYLRRLDLSFNHIQRLENLNNLRLLWLDVSYNNISSFEFGPQKGLYTLLHLEYLNLNENSITSLKMFSGCTRLRELHARNNRMRVLLELAVYLRQLRRLIVLDLRANPICSTPGYRDVVINTFPILLTLDAMDLDPIEQRSSKMNMIPDINCFAIRRLLRLLYIEQLSRALVSPHSPPADTTEVPIVVLVGYEAVGKGSLARRLASECQSHVQLAIQHTTATHHFPGHYKEVSRSKFDDMLLAGDLLTYTEMTGESYGLSREEAVINNGQVRLVTMDLIGALMLKFRGKRPYLILTTYLDKKILAKRQQERKKSREDAARKHMCTEAPYEKSTLQVLLSGRIIITGILNEILMTLPDEIEQSKFIIESECSLMMENDQRQTVREYVRGVNLLTLLASATITAPQQEKMLKTVENVAPIKNTVEYEINTPRRRNQRPSKHFLLYISNTSMDEASKRIHERNIEADSSLCSLFKESQQGTDEYNSDLCGQNASYQERNQGKKTNDNKPTRNKQERRPTLPRPKSVDFSRYTSSTWKGLSAQAPGSSKSSKSVTFISPENGTQVQEDITGLLIGPPEQVDHDDKQLRSLSTRAPWQTRCQSTGSAEDADLWLAFLAEVGIMQDSVMYQASEAPGQFDAKVDETEAFFKELEFYHQELAYETATSTIKDDYESIHRKHPGIFWDVVVMDKPNEAFRKVKRIIRDIVNSQQKLNPMFDINFTNMLENYPTVQSKLASIRDQIAPRKLFY